MMGIECVRCLRVERVVGSRGGCRDAAGSMWTGSDIERVYTFIY